VVAKAVSYGQPIEARCRHCDGSFELHELLSVGNGRCPRCDTLISPEWTSVLLEEAAEADRSERQFVKALRRLVALPGNMIVLPHSVLALFWNEVGWEQPLARVPELLEEEVRLERLEFERWEGLGALASSTHRPWGLGAHLRPSFRHEGDR
jgi:hypothetical protein